MLIGQEEKYRKLGLNIAFYHKKCGYSQTKLADILDISNAHLCRIENGSCAVSLDIVFKLCDILSVPPKNLFDFRE